MEWWINNFGNWNRRTIQQITTEIEIEIETCLQDGLGSVLQWRFHGRLLVSGRENSSHQCTRIDAAIFGVQASCKDRKVTSVLLKSDNATVVTHVNKMGGTKSPLLTQLVKDIWHWYLQQHIHLRSQHLPGRLNFRPIFFLTTYGTGLTGFSSYSP